MHAFDSEHKMNENLMLLLFLCIVRLFYVLASMCGVSLFTCRSNDLVTCWVVKVTCRSRDVNTLSNGLI